MSRGMNRTEHGDFQLMDDTGWFAGWLMFCGETPNVLPKLYREATGTKRPMLVRLTHQVGRGLTDDTVIWSFKNRS